MQPDAQQPVLTDLARRLRLKESLLEAHMNASSDALMAISIEGDVWHVNRRFRQMWGVPTSEGRPRCDIEMWPGVLKQLHEPKRFLDTMDMLSRDPQRSFEWQVSTRSGRIVDCMSMPIAESPGGTSAGRLWIFRDLTEKHRVQDELHRARRLATVGEFGRSIAQEFRNVLLAVAGFSQMLGAALNANDALGEYVRGILRATQHGRSLVEHLLAFAHGRAATDQLLSVGAVLQDTLAFLRVAARGSVELRTEVDEGLPLVLADAVGLQQILIDLVVNASRAIHEQDGRIEIRVTSHTRRDERHANGDDAAGPSRFVRLSVSDSGNLSRADLAAVREIVANQGGLISIDRRPAEGTTVHVDFPVASVAPAQDT
jgi:signal transduction histidine kinase